VCLFFSLLICLVVRIETRTDTRILTDLRTNYKDILIKFILFVRWHNWFHDLILIGLYVLAVWMVLATSRLDLQAMEDENFINGLELKLWSSSWLLLGSNFVYSGGQRRPLVGTERLENVQELLGELHKFSLRRWLVRRRCKTGSWWTWSYLRCARRWWAPKGGLTRTAVRGGSGGSGGSHLHGGYRICHLRSLVIAQCDDRQWTWTIRWRVGHWLG